MADLLAKSPCDGLLPIKIGTTSLTELDPGAIWSLSPFRGQDGALSDALKAAHGMTWPAPNRARGKVGARAIWFGRRHALLMGPDADSSLAAHAVLTDQSDAWAVVRLDGADAEHVLARLVPVDLRCTVFKRGHTVRTELKHMVTSITRVADHGFQIMVFRSMAQTLVHDLNTAMTSVGVATRR